MAIKIDQMYPSHSMTGRRNQIGNESRPEGAVGGKAEDHAAAGVTLTLTKSAGSLGRLVESADDPSGASKERIDQLRSSINSGTYEIDSQKIAKKLMDLEFGLN